MRIVYSFLGNSIRSNANTCFSLAFLVHITFFFFFFSDTAIAISSFSLLRLDGLRHHYKSWETCTLVRVSHCYHTNANMISIMTVCFMTTPLSKLLGICDITKVHTFHLNFNEVSFLYRFSNPCLSCICVMNLLLKLTPLPSCPMSSALPIGPDNTTPR